LNILGVNSTTSVTDNLQKVSVRLRSTIAPQGTLNTQVEATDKVSISNEAQKKLSSELSSTMRNNARGATSPQTKQVDTRTEIEKKIDQLKEDIKELQAQRRELIGDNSEEAELQRKVLDHQITMLNTQLISLFKIQKEAQK
jgi:organic radical activating enzyme|tara:strand:+ start:8698 stop:9123 length:426 start_codon:yes stop_codon:yes gene_type:complete